MSERQSATQRLVNLAGADVLKKPKVTEEIFREVMSEIHQERADKAKIRARELVLKALELHDQKVKLENEFKAQLAKFDKDLGKVLSQLENDMSQASGGQIVARYSTPFTEEEAEEEVKRESDGEPNDK